MKRTELEEIKISCVVLCFNSARSIDKCLQSLRDSLVQSSIHYEIWVVDNGSCDESIQIVQHHQDEDSRIQLIQLESNQGTTRPRNLALQQCSGEWILVLDSDAYITAAGLNCLLDELVKRPQVGIVAPQLVFPDGRSQLSTDQFPTIPRKLQRLLMLRRLEKASDDALQATESPRAKSVDYAISAVWLMRAELLSAVGPLDEKIFYAPEDADYCLRTWECGFQVRYQPAATIVHDAQEKSRSLVPNYFMWVHLKGLAYYFLKHRYCMSAKRLRKRIGVKHDLE